jgi:hypothetical protein
MLAMLIAGARIGILSNSLMQRESWLSYFEEKDTAK